MKEKLTSKLSLKMSLPLTKFEHYFAKFIFDKFLLLTDILLSKVQLCFSELFYFLIFHKFYETRVVITKGLVLLALEDCVGPVYGLRITQGLN